MWVLHHCLSLSGISQILPLVLHDCQCLMSVSYVSTSYFTLRKTLDSEVAYKYNCIRYSSHQAQEKNLGTCIQTLQHMNFDELCVIARASIVAEGHRWQHRYQCSIRERYLM